MVAPRRFVPHPLDGVRPSLVAASEMRKFVLHHLTGCDHHGRRILMRKLPGVAVAGQAHLGGGQQVFELGRTEQFQFPFPRLMVAGDGAQVVVHHGR